MPPVPVPLHLSTAAAHALLFCLSVPALALSPSSQCLLCVPLPGSVTPPLFSFLSPQPATATNLSDLTPSLALPTRPVSHLCSWDYLTLQACSPTLCPSPGCGPRTGLPWESCIPGCPQTLRPSTTPPSEIPHYWAQVPVQPPLGTKPPKGSPGTKVPFGRAPNFSNEWSPDLVPSNPHPHHKLSGGVTSHLDTPGRRTRER